MKGESLDKKTQNQRAQYVVDRVFQQRLATVLTIMALLIVGVLLLGLTVAVTYAVSFNPRMVEAPLTLGLVGQAMQEMWWLVLVLTVMCLALSYSIIYFYSHRIAGPVYRLRHVLDDLAEGKIHTQVQLRQGDCFENLAASVLRANATLASSITELKSDAASLAKKAKSQADRKDRISGMQQVLDRFQVVGSKKAEDETAASDS